MGPLPAEKAADAMIIISQGIFTIGPFYSPKTVAIGKAIASLHLIGVLQRLGWQIIGFLSTDSQRQQLII